MNVAEVTFKMKEVKDYLDSATIHGLSYIAGTRGFARLFWMMVVVTSFREGLKIHLICS